MAILRSKPLKDSIARCDGWALNNNLDAHNARFNHWVIVQHDEGTQYCFNCAFIEQDPENAAFVWVFTEHQGYHVFAVDELSLCLELTEVKRVDACIPEG